MLIHLPNSDRSATNAVPPYNFRIDPKPLQNYKIQPLMTLRSTFLLFESILLNNLI